LIAAVVVHTSEIGSKAIHAIEKDFCMGLQSQWLPWPGVVFQSAGIVRPIRTAPSDVAGEIGIPARTELRFQAPLAGRPPNRTLTGIAWVRGGREARRAHSVGVCANFNYGDTARLEPAYGSRLERLT
jgi:hypothetical protein